VRRGSYCVHRPLVSEALSPGVGRLVVVVVSGRDVVVVEVLVVLVLVVLVVVDDVLVVASIAVVAVEQPARSRSARIRIFMVCPSLHIDIDMQVLGELLV